MKLLSERKEQDLREERPQGCMDGGHGDGWGKGEAEVGADDPLWRLLRGSC